MSQTYGIMQRPLDVTISDKSGLASIAYWINSHLRLEGGETIDKRHPGIVRIHEWDAAQYDKGRVTGISSGERRICRQRSVSWRFAVVLVRKCMAI